MPYRSRRRPASSTDHSAWIASSSRSVADHTARSYHTPERPFTDGPRKGAIWLAVAIGLRAAICSRMMRWNLAAIAAACGCGGATHDAERARLKADEPVPPYDVRSIRGYTAPSDCGQGPYRVEATALGARFGESIEVMLCAPRHLQ